MNSRNLARFRLPALGLVVLMITGIFGTIPAANAAPANPVGLSPASSSVSGSPTLSWAGVPGATEYQIQASVSAEFAPLLFDVRTANTRYVPNKQLPAGEIFWRVRARDSSGWGLFTTARFTRSALAAPAPVSPEDGASLPQPDVATLLTWAPVNGASEYTIQFDDDNTFITPTSTVTTKGSSYLLASPKTGTPYYWRVRSDYGSGYSSDYSEARRFTLLPLQGAQNPDPEDDDLGLNPGIEDVVLTWDPIVGATSYDIRISTDINFESDGFQTSSVTNRWSPVTTLNNDQYYWEVRPVDALGNRPEWNDPTIESWVFKREWPDQAVMQHPLDGSTVGTPMFYQWKPIEHASSYLIQLSTEPTFATPYDSCTTVHTTYIPTKAGDCWPKSNVVTYWRVRGTDAPANVVTDLIAAPVGSFTFSPASVSLIAPLSGTPEVPTFRWQPLTGAKTYRLTVHRVSDGKLMVNVSTSGTSYTPTTILPAGIDYRWDVVATSDSGIISPAREAADQPTFTLGTQSTPTEPIPNLLTPSNGAVSYRMPSMTWDAVAGATSYRLYVRGPGQIWPAEGSPTVTTVYPAHTLSALYNEGAYDWYVAAYDGTTKLSDNLSSYRTVNVFRDRAVTGQRISVTGLGLGDPATSCDHALADAEPRCEDISVTPTFGWEPDPEATAYSITFSRDQEMTNQIATYKTESNYWTPVGTYADSQAGDAYFWIVQACKPTCPGVPYATHAFDKLSHAAEPISPAQGAVVADAVTFTWEDWAQTNERVVDSLTGIPTQMEAQRYGVQVSTDENFVKIIDSVTVDQTTYTSTSKSYPDGPLWWRVRAIDGSGEGLLWSRGVEFRKSSPVPTPKSPLNGQSVSGTQPLLWEPMEFAKGYEVQVYKNGDTRGQTANLILNSTTNKQTAYASTSPLPSSGNPYVWRVRRVDSGGNVTAWSSLTDASAQFNVAATAATQTTPGPGAPVGASDGYFAWSAVDGATSYKFERRALGAISNAETVTTPALAWAPTAKLATGTHEWRVSSLDANGVVMASSPWRTYVVSAPPATGTTTPPPPAASTPPPPPTTDKVAPAVSKVSPAAGTKVKKGVTFKAVFSEKVKNVTAKTFTLKQKGKARTISAKVTLSSDGKTAKLNPKKNLKSRKTYIAKLSSKITDMKGNALVVKKWKVKVK